MAITMTSQFFFSFFDKLLFTDLKLQIYNTWIPLFTDLYIAHQGPT